jgi:ribosome biogenesis GTPase A
LTDDVLIESPVAAPQYVEASAPPAQVCDRCHNLIHHSEGVSAPSPTIDSIGAFLDESPHTRNRIYHVIDAADFPMSIIPGIYKALSVQRQRSKNRRAKTVKYKYGKRMTTISFVVTRSDLLAATKEQVDSKMQYIRNILLSTLRIKSEDVRLGNVHMISAHRGWWTKSVKGDIREHGGGIWVVGKANVGKSSFIQTCFPKSSKDLEKVEELLNQRQTGFNPLREVDVSILNSDNLLPPAPREELFPTLPIVSPLPGTTVSPIRIPFGRGKGEVIDLPGLHRETLQSFVKDEHKANLIMTTRVSPKRLTIKPGQSLLLGGGLIRITPVDSMNVILAACFLPLETHVTKTEKAIEVQTQNRAYVGKTIMRDGTGDILSSAGVFELNFDTTRNHLPAVVKKILDDKSIPSPYRVMSMDLLIEGCGWIELTAQIRARENPETSTMLPKVEAFSPHGKYIGSRPPMESWAFIAQKRDSDKRKNGSDRPMRQNISQKKRELHSSKL